MRSAGSRLRSMFVSSASARVDVAGADRLGQLEDAVLARLGDQVLDVVDADRPLAADVDRQLLQRLRQPAQLGPGQRRQRVGGVGRDGDLARLGLATAASRPAPGP